MLSTRSEQVASFLRWMAEERDAEAKRIGHLIAKLRQARGWNQADLAHEVGVGVSTISRWERGLHKGYGPNIRKLAKALSVDPAVVRPREPEIQTQLDRIENELKRQAALLQELVTDVRRRNETPSGREAPAPTEDRGIVAAAGARLLETAESQTPRAPGRSTSPAAAQRRKRA